MKVLNPIKILIVDTQVLAYELLCRSVNCSNTVIIVGLAQTESELYAAIEKLRPQIILIDADTSFILPRVLKNYLSKKKMNCLLLVLKSKFEPYVLNEFCLAGIKGFVTKDDSFETLLQGFNELMKSGNFISPCADKIFLEHMQNFSSVANGVDCCFRTEEMSTLMLICAANNPKEIALRLNVTIRTINRYKKGLFQKTNTRSDVGLFLFALKNKLVVCSN